MESQTMNHDALSTTDCNFSETGEDETELASIPATPEGFSVHDHATANWVVRKIVETRRYRRRIREWAELETRRAEREEQFFMMRFGRQLEDWALSQIAAGDRKSVKLPAGTVGYRTEAIRLEVKDEQRLIAWCRQSLPDALRVETHVLKSLVHDHLHQTGECPDGTDVAGGGQKFFVK
jgi:hypothetical protein